MTADSVSLSGSMSRSGTVSSNKKRSSTLKILSKSSDRDDGSNEDGRRPGKQWKGEAKCTPDDPGNWACPYAKRFREKFGTDSRCGEKSCSTIADLKNHLFKLHQNPYCEYCGKDGFGGSDCERRLEQHRQDNECNTSQRPSKD